MVGTYDKSKTSTSANYGAYLNENKGTGTSFRNNHIQNQWILFEMESVNEINQETKEYLEQIKPVVLQGYKEVYKPKHIEVSDNKYKVLLPKNLLEEKGLQFFFIEYLVIGLN